MSDEPTESRATFTEYERVRDGIDRCLGSSQDRMRYCLWLRDWYERCSSDGTHARYKKLRAHLDRLGSYIFAPDTARFSPHVPKPVRAVWAKATDVARDEFRDAWRDAGADLVFSMLMEWALVFGATVGKVQRHPSSQFMLGYIQPWDFGVSREDVPNLDDQDLMAHRYTLSLPQVNRWLSINRPRDHAALYAEAERYATHGSDASRQRGSVIVNAISGGNVSGNVDTPAGQDALGPRVGERLVTFVDLWERRQFRRQFAKKLKPVTFEDYLVTTVIENGAEIFTQRRNPDLQWTIKGAGEVLAAENPFFSVVPRPQPDYFFGRSELIDSLKVQGDVEDTLAKMIAAGRRRMDPSYQGFGVEDADETLRALQTEGGFAGSSNPSGKIEKFNVELTEVEFTLFHTLLSVFDDAAGTPEITKEGAAENVRNTGQLTTAAGIAGGRIRKVALFVESSLARAATLSFHTIQRHDDSVYPIEDAKPEDKVRSFALWQIPVSMVRVDSHSASPIYAEQTQAKALVMKREKAIGSDDFVELLDPPGRDELKLKARERDRAMAKAASEQMRIQEMKATKKK